MAKKSKKKKRSKNMNVQGGQLPPIKLLQKFKNLRNAGDWPSALHAYRAWTNRTAKKRNPAMEGELLFRCASDDFKEKNIERALHRLEEARQLDPANSARYDYYKALGLAKNQQLAESRQLFSLLGDEFHHVLLSRFLEFAQTLPADLFDDPPVPPPEIINFCRDFLETNTLETAIKHPGLKNIGNAFVLLKNRKDPEPPLKLLMKKNGFEGLAVHLLLIVNIFRKSSVKLQNMIKKFAPYLKEDFFQDIIAALLVTFLNEAKYDRVRQLDRLLTENGIPVKEIDKIRDEVNFRLGLAAIEAHRLEAAVDYFEMIDQPTPAVLHNLALCLQELERYGEANNYWTRLLGLEKKPKKNDSSETIGSYCTILKYIGRNFMREYETEEAQKYFKQVLRLDKTDKEALESLMVTSIDEENHHETLEYARRLYRMEPTADEYFFTYLMELQYCGQTDIMISVCKEALEKSPDNPLLHEMLVAGYTEKAWQYRDKEPFESIRLIKDAGRYAVKNARLIFLEGYIQYKDGQKKAAEKKFRKAAGTAYTHQEEFQLGAALYDVGMQNEALKLFKKLADCACDTSARLYEEAILLLANRDDYKNTARLCDYGVKQELYWLIEVAETLYEVKKYQWAKEYSTRAMKEEELDDGEKFLHLLILNKTGEKDELLDCAVQLQREAETREDFNGVYMYNQIIKEIKSRGRFKTR
jgi:tetratricopeptide (TPR) repeat protein